MKILSILPTHNATAALFKDDLCLAYLHEEKFNNQKNFWGFPQKSLDYLQKKFGLNDLDYIVFPSTQLFRHSLPNFSSGLSTTFENLNSTYLKNCLNFLEYYLPGKNIFTTFRSLVLDHYISPKSRRLMRKYLSTKYHIQPQKILFLDHHTCHALSPVYFYNLHLKKEKTLLFTLDGSGDNFSAKSFIYDPHTHHLRLLSQSSFAASPGLLYSGLTQYLGMKANEHEYKVMGLAAYVSDPKYYQPILKKLEGIITLDPKNLNFHSRFNTNLSKYFFKNFNDYRFDNLSAAVQNYVENLVLEWITLTQKRYRLNQAAFSGGVFMNVKLNQKIQSLPFLNRVYFMPSSGDESLAYGAVYYVYCRHHLYYRSDSSMYHGINYTHQEIDSYLEHLPYKSKYHIKILNNPELSIAQLLADHQIVAYFTGEGEWGARSLCHRTILSNASDINAYYQINDTIKMRDFWMPFAPTILLEYAHKYIKNWSTLSPKVKASSKYMITAFDTTILAQKDLIAAIHPKDKTIRPQLVSVKDNPSLHRLLTYFSKLTGLGGLMNTSLNIHGFPLVGTLEQAFFTLDNSKLKYLVIDNYLITKN
jgi:carbamoyltransferase